MSSITSSLNVNVNAETKKEASKVLDELGLNMTTAINIYLTLIAYHRTKFLYYYIIILYNSKVHTHLYHN